MPDRHVTIVIDRLISRLSTKSEPLMKVKSSVLSFIKIRRAFPNKNSKGPAIKAMNKAANPHFQKVTDDLPFRCTPPCQRIKIPVSSFFASSTKSYALLKSTCIMLILLASTKGDAFTPSLTGICIHPSSTSDCSASAERR